MTFEAFNKHVRKQLNQTNCTLATHPLQRMQEELLYAAGEFGELINTFKHYKRAIETSVPGPEAQNLYGDMNKEMGDVLWYLTAFMNTAYMNMSGILEDNKKKLEARHGKVE